MVEGAEARAGDDDEAGPDGFGQVGHRDVAPQRDEQPAGAFHHDPVEAVAGLLQVGQEAVDVDDRPGPLRRHGRRQWLGEPEALEDRDLGGGGDEGGVTGLGPLQAGLHRLDVEHRPAGRPVRPAEGGGGQRLADPCVGPGDEADHRFPRPFMPAPPCA